MVTSSNNNCNGMNGDHASHNKPTDELHHHHENGEPANIWTTCTSRSSSKSNFTSGSYDLYYIQPTDIETKDTTTVQNGSSAKLLPYDDQTNSQVSAIKKIINK